MKSPSTDKSKLPLIVIVGPTASGKTALAVKLAEKFNGEIICADSRTIYRGLDVGTAKPSPDERSRVPHWGLDLVEANQVFSAARFKQYASTKIIELRSRGKMPFLVGGSGLYIDAVVFNFEFFDDLDYDYLRKKYNKLTTEELVLRCQKNKIALPENWQNRLHLINHLIRQGRQAQRQTKPIENCYLFGLKSSREVLLPRIKQRLSTMFKLAVIEEALACAEKYGWDCPGLSGNIYPFIRRYLNQEITFKELLALATINDWHLAKRQMTWFKRHSEINWLSLESSEQIISERICDMLK